MRKDAPNLIGLDRINNDYGYTVQNSAPCCWDCNNRKNSMRLQDMLTVLIEAERRGLL